MRKILLNPALLEEFNKDRNSMSLRELETKYSVPKSTISRFLNGGTKS